LEVAVDLQKTVVLLRYTTYPLPALTDIGPAAAARKHTTAPINHARPSPQAFTRRRYPERGIGHPITAYYSPIDLERIKG